MITIVKKKSMHTKPNRKAEGIPAARSTHQTHEYPTLSFQQPLISSSFGNSVNLPKIIMAYTSTHIKSHSIRLPTALTSWQK